MKNWQKKEKRYEQKYYFSFHDLQMNFLFLTRRKNITFSLITIEKGYELYGIPTQFPLTFPSTWKFLLSVLNECRKCKQSMRMIKIFFMTLLDGLKITSRLKDTVRNTYSGGSFIRCRSELQKLTYR